MFGKKKKKNLLEEDEVKEVNELTEADIDATDSAVEIPEKKAEEEKPTEPKKKKKLIGAWDTFSLYKFIFEIVAAALLLALGFLIIFNENESKFAMFIIASGAILITLFIRVFIMIKKRKEYDKKLKKFILCESLIELLLGLAMVFAAMMTISSKAEDADTSIKIRNWFNDTFAYWGSGILYTFSVSYFIRIIIFKEYTDDFRFWMNFVFITGSLLFLFFKSYTDLTAFGIAVAIAVLAFLCALILGFDAGGGYYNYYKRTKDKSEKKKEKKEESKDAPAKDDTVIINDEINEQDSERIS